MVEFVFKFIHRRVKQKIWFLTWVANLIHLTVVLLFGGRQNF